MTAPIVISDEAASRASRMWDEGYPAGDISRSLGVNAKWFENYRKKNRDIFPLRCGGKPVQREIYIDRPARTPRAHTMPWQTEAGAVVTLARVSFIECPRVRA